RGQDRADSPGGRPGAEEPGADGALHGRHRHRDLRLPPAAVREDRPHPLSDMRRAGRVALAPVHRRGLARRAPGRARDDHVRSGRPRRPPAGGALGESHPAGLRARPDRRRRPRPRRSAADGAVEPWTHPSGRRYQRELMKASRRRKVDTETPWEKLSEATRGFVYAGDGSFPGIQGFFEEVESYRYKLHVRVFLSRYRSQSVCQTCHGARLKPAALAVRVAGLTIAEFTALTIDGAARLLGHLGLSAW